MIRILYICYAATAALAVVLLAARLFGERLRRRRRPRERLLCRYAVREIVSAQLSGYAAPVRLPLRRLVGRRHRLCELLSELAAATYGLDAAPVRELVRRYGLDRWLLRRIRFSRGCRRARYLKWLADLPADGRTAREAARYLDDPCREVRFCALLVRIAADPQQVLRSVAAFDPPLTDGETAEVVHLLRRGLLPIAYRPLIESENGSLCRLGLAIVERFGIEEAEETLLRIVAEADDARSAAALRVLVSMHRSLRRREVTERVRRMTRDELRGLLRLLAREGYALRSVRHLFDAEERFCYESIVGSYKRQLVWS